MPFPRVSSDFSVTGLAAPALPPEGGPRSPLVRKGPLQVRSHVPPSRPGPAADRGTVRRAATAARFRKGGAKSLNDPPRGLK